MLKHITLTHLILYYSYLLKLDSNIYIYTRQVLTAVLCAKISLIYTYALIYTSFIPLGSYYRESA